MILFIIPYTWKNFTSPFSPSKVVTDTWLWSNPANSWSCGFQYSQVVFYTDNVKLEDTKYFFSRVRTTKDVDDFYRDTILCLQPRGVMYSNGCKLDTSRCSPVPKELVEEFMKYALNL